MLNPKGKLQKDKVISSLFILLEGITILPTYLFPEKLQQPNCFPFLSLLKPSSTWQLWHIPAYTLQWLPTAALIKSTFLIKVSLVFPNSLHAPWCSHHPSLCARLALPWTQGTHSYVRASALACCSFCLTYCFLSFRF